MTIGKSDLLKRLQDAVSADEWRALEEGREMPVSAFNQKTLMELKSAKVFEEEEIPEEKAAGLHKTLQKFLGEHLEDKPEGWKWIIISCMYLTFIAQRPMHPAEAVGIKESLIDKKRVYECPAKSSGKNTACYYCVCTRMSNYEIMKRRMQKEFIKYDPDKMIEKFRLKSDADYIYIRFVGREYRIDRVSGEVWQSEDGFAHMEEADYNEAMTIYDVLCYSKDGCSLHGEFVSMDSLSSVKGGSLSEGSGLFQKTEEAFDHKDALLERACEKLGGVKMGKGDVAYRISLFDFLPVVIQFWNSDEDFPASLQIFADKNMLDYMHYETVWFAVSHLIGRLKEEMGRL